MNSILNGTTLSARDQPLIGAVNLPDVLITSFEYFKRAKHLLSRKEGGHSSLVLRMLHPDPERPPQDYPVLIAAIEKM